MSQSTLERIQGDISHRDTILALIRAAGGDGLTDYEIEDATGWSHQSVSASRRGLVLDKVVTERRDQRGIIKRLNQFDNYCTVWVTY